MEESKDDLSFSSEYMNEQDFVQETGFGASAAYSNYLEEKNLTSVSFFMLRTMTTGLSHRVCLEYRIAEFLKKTWLSKSDINITKDLLKLELQRRYNLAKACEEVDLPTKVKTSGTVDILLKRLGGEGDTTDRQ